MNPQMKLFFIISATLLSTSGVSNTTQAEVATSTQFSITTPTAALTQKSVVYHIISGVSTTTATTTITVNTLTSRNQYDCNVLTFTCQFLKENVAVRDEKAFEEITLVSKKYADIIPNNIRTVIAPAGTTTMSTSSIPAAAKYVTPSIANAYTAYYTTPVDTVKKTRTYSVFNSTS